MLLYQFLIFIFITYYVDIDLITSPRKKQHSCLVILIESYRNSTILQKEFPWQ